MDAQRGSISSVGRSPRNMNMNWTGSNGALNGATGGGGGGEEEEEEEEVDVVTGSVAGAVPAAVALTLQVRNRFIW